MALLDAVAKSVFSSLTAKFGKTLRLQVFNEVEDFSQGTTTQTEVFGSPFTVQGLVESFSPVFNAGAQFDGVEIHEGDLKVSIPAEQIKQGSKKHKPTPGDVLWFPEENTNLPDVKRTIKAVQKAYGGDDVYSYICLVRQ